LKVRTDDLADLRVPAVPPALQRPRYLELESGVAPLFKARRALLKQIDLLQEHRQALITAAVTGELDVPGVAA
jgi:type I restriction enzyme S subunit